jgi:hypothetical protein
MYRPIRYWRLNFAPRLPAAQSHPELQLGPGLIAPQLPRAVE